MNREESSEENTSREDITDEDVNSYFTMLGASSLTSMKYGDIKRVARSILPSTESLKQIFITNEKKGESIILNNLFIFTDNFMLESKKYLGDSFNIDVLFYGGFISHYEVQSRNFNFLTQEANGNSWMSVTGNVENTYFILNAVGENCERLWEIVTDYLAPNIYNEIMEESEE